MNKMATFFRESMVARFLIPAGIALLAFGIVTLIIDIKNQNYIEVDAVVSKADLYEEAHTDADGTTVDATYTVYVKYTVDGKEYETELGVLSGYKKDQKIKIYYNPKNPKEITQTISLVLPIVMIVGGAAAIVGGVISGVNSIKKYKKMKKQEEGWKKDE